MKYLFLNIFLLTAITNFAQTKSVEKEKRNDNDLSKANENFATKNYADAEANYRISASNFPKKGIHTKK